MAGLIVLGSVVRTTGSGLACPDWPLCEGRLIPRFESHVLIEWSHRVVALVVSMLLLSTVAWTVTQAPVRRRLGGLVSLSVALLFVQILLGALTVWKLLSPSVVSSHLAVALLLFATFVNTALVARAGAGSGDPATGAPDAIAGSAATVSAHPSTAFASRPGWLLPLFVVAAVLVYVQAVLGGVVSTSHAGLACPDWPTCRGEWFPPLRGLVGLHVAHRYGGYLVAILVGVAFVAARTVADRSVRRGAMSALHLVLLQVLVGIGNVMMGTPVAMSALHLGIAAALLAALIATAHRIGGLPVAHPDRLSATPAPAQVASSATASAGRPA